MPTIKQCQNIIKKTPCNQAIMFDGIHGIGKSKVVEKFIIDMGFRFQPLFVGQMADAGDLIGLPDKEKNEKTGYIHTVFRPPFWWPKSEGERFVLFLDEINRGKPEIMQCIMDMVLNRKLMGKSLPEGCQIIAAGNNLTDDGYYQVNELDPALLDRFNRYEFKPSYDEWRDWAIDNRLHPKVIGFISNNFNFLDPLTDIKDGAKVNDVQPSRRSWERVSNLLIENKDMEDNEKDIYTFVHGIIGHSATSSFNNYIALERKNLNANNILMNWDCKVEDELKTYKIKDILHMNRQIAFWLERYEEELLLNKTMQVTISKGLSKYLDFIDNESMAQFLNILATDNTKGKSYARTIMRINDDLGERYFNILNDHEEEEKILFSEDGIK